MRESGEGMRESGEGVRERVGSVCVCEGEIMGSVCVREREWGVCVRKS